MNHLIDQKVKESNENGENNETQRRVCMQALADANLANAKGYKPIRTIPDVRRTDYVNWVFSNTPEFERDVELYFDEIKNR